MLYALDGNRNNQLVNIFDNKVESRRPSNKFICISCKNEVTANKGKQRKYFSHKAEKSDYCPSLVSQKNPALHQGESIVHHLAKEIFSEAKQILMPGHYIYSEEKFDLDNKIFPAQKIWIEEKIYPIVPSSMEIEQILKEFGVKPDLFCLIKDRQKEIPLLIEISVNHSCHDSPEKKDKIKNNKLNCVEIDLENLHEKFLNVKKLENNEVDPVEIQKIEDQIKNAIKDKKRYELINLFSEDRVVLEKELNDSYNKDLIIQNNRIISKRFESYNHVLLDGKLIDISEVQKGIEYTCICCSGIVNFHGKSISHSNCSYLDGYGSQKEDYSKKYIFLKIIEDLKSRNNIKFPNQKHFVLSDVKVQTFKSLNSLIFNVKNVFYFNKEAYIIKEVEPIDDLSLFKLKVEDPLDNRIIDLVFFLNFEGKDNLFEKDLKDVANTCLQTYGDYFISLDVKDLKNDYEDNVLFKSLNFKNWESLSGYVSTKEIDFLTVKHVDKLAKFLDEKQKKEEHLRLEALRERKEKIENGIKLVLNESNQLILKEQVNNIEKYFCVCCHEELKLLQHKNMDCMVFENPEYYDWTVYYYKTLNELKNISGTNVVIDRFIIRFFSFDKKFLHPSIRDDGISDMAILNFKLYIDKVYENEPQNVITVEAINEQNGNFKFHFNLNFEEKSKDFLNSLDLRNYYIDKTYKNVRNKSKVVDLNEEFLIPSPKEREMIVKNYSNKKMMRLEKEQEQLREELRKKEENKKKIQDILIAKREKDLNVRSILEKENTFNLKRRLNKYKEQKRWNKKKIDHIAQLEINRETTLETRNVKLHNWKVSKSLSNKKIILANINEKKELNSDSIELFDYLEPECFIVNNKIKFKKTNSNNNIEQLFDLIENITKEDEGFICVPFEIFNTNLFDSIQFYLDLNDIGVILNLENKNDKHEYAFKKYYPCEYYLKNIRQGIDVENSFTFFRENKNYIEDIVKEDFSDFLFNTIKYYEETKSNNCLKVLHILEKEILNNLSHEKIAKTIKYFSGNKEFDQIYQQYFAKYNLYEDTEEQKKLLDTLMFKSSEAIENFFSNCDSINSRLSADTLKNDYVENNNLKSLFMLSRRNIDLKDIIKEEHLELIDKLNQPTIDKNVILRVFPVKFGKLGFKK